MNTARRDETFEHGDLSFSLKKGKNKVAITIGDETRVIQMKDLWGIAYTIANGPHKEKIMPVQKKEMMRFKKVHNVLLKKDMKAGEMMTVACLVDVPTLIAEGMANPIDGEPLDQPLEISTPDTPASQE